MKKTPMMAAGINPAKPKMMVRIKAPKQSAKSNTYKMYIYDDVSAYGKFDWNTWSYLESETSANYFREQLDMIPENATIELYVNSNGGSVKEGVSIYNQLLRHKANKVAYVDGFAYSVASLICMACSKVVMGMGTSMLVHNMWMEVAGNAEELRKAADDLDALMETNRKIYLKRSGGRISEEELSNIMEEERILTPSECLQYGFADQILEMDEEDDTEEDSEEDTDSDMDDDQEREDEEDEKSPNQIMPLHIMNRQRYISQRQALKRQMQQLNKDAVPAMPGKNKCMEFFEQFM
ncbi:MAG: Clp protease ClpP [Lachnospiraceae bacterium]|nr:Clp protease ClpP [Lachnospiraceae bacterium]